MARTSRIGVGWRQRASVPNLFLGRKPVHNVGAYDAGDTVYDTFSSVTFCAGGVRV